MLSKLLPMHCSTKITGAIELNNLGYYDLPFIAAVMGVYKQHMVTKPWLLM